MDRTEPPKSDPAPSAPQPETRRSAEREPDTRPAPVITDYASI